MHLACVVGARPNFMKMAPLLQALEGCAGARTTLIHTGQHYDRDLSDVFFEDLGMRRPDTSLDVGGGKPAAQTAKIMERMEDILAGHDFDRVVVVGDVNSTLAASLAAAKCNVPIAHVEAGLRSFDRSMPEEVNRIVTDALSDMLFVSEPAGVENLQREGKPDHQIHLVGNIMIDTLLRLHPKAIAGGTLSRFGLSVGAYGVATLHRPFNVDVQYSLQRLVDSFIEIARDLPLVFAVHPRTQAKLEQFGLSERLECAPGILRVPPQGYLDFLALTSQARLIITDSGGLQEEATALGVPCLTLRPNTERPITVEQGTSTLIGEDLSLLRAVVSDVLNGSYKIGRCPEIWDGQAAEKIARVLTECRPV